MSNEWIVFDYESNMALKLSYYLPEEAYIKLAWELQNAVIESLVLHTRILTELVLGEKGYTDDITIKKLIPHFPDARIADLKKVYDDPVPGGSLDRTPRFQFNKLLAHATTHRTVSHEYLPALKQVWRVLAGILDEIREMRP